MSRGVLFGLVLSVLTILSVNAQDVNVFNDDINESYFSVGGGISIPAGNYGTSTSLSTSGFALPGPGITAEGVFYFSKYFGLGLRAGYNRHFIAEKAWAELTLQEAPEDADFIVSAGSQYEIATLQLGVYTSMKINSWLRINGKAMMGPHFVAMPEFNFDYYNEYEFYEQTLVDDWQITNNAARSWQFGYLTGLGVSITPSRGFAVDINLDYVNSHQKFEYTSNSQGVTHDELGVPQQLSGESDLEWEDNFRYMLLSGSLKFFF